MLNFIRRNQSLFMILFAACAWGLVISFGLPDMTPTVGAQRGLFWGTKVVAQVGSEKISMLDLQRDLLKREEQLRRYFGSQMGTEQGERIFEQIRKSQLNPDRILDDMIQRKLVSYLFEKQGLQVANSSVRSQIEELPYFKKNGSFDPALYRKLVTSPNDFENGIREQLKGDKILESLALISTVITEDEVALGRVFSKKTDFELLSLSPKQIRDAVTVDESEIKKTAQDEAKKPELQTYYNRNLKEYKRAEEISAKHILIREEDGGEKRIKEIATEINSGKISFENAAKKYSKDASNANRGGDLGYFGKGVMDKAFESAAFALQKKGEISAPVKSDFGYHLILLVDRKAGFEKKFDEVREDLARAYLLDQKKLERAKELAESWLSSKNGPDAATLKKYELVWSKAQPWDPGQRRLGFLADTDISAAELMSLSKEAPLLKRAIPLNNSIVLVRWVGSKDEAVTLEELAFQKSLRLSDTYLQKFRKNLEDSKQIKKSEKLLAQLKDLPKE